MGIGIGGMLRSEIASVSNFAREAARKGPTEDLQHRLADVLEEYGPHVMEALDDGGIGRVMTQLEITAFSPRHALDGVSRLRTADSHLIAAYDLTSQSPVDAAAWKGHMEAAYNALHPMVD